jgi:translocation and assembly module TamA
MSRAILVLLAVAACLTPVSTGLGQGVTVDVQFEGVTGELEENVRAVSALQRATGRGERSEATTLWLFDRAPAEIELALQPFGFYRPRIESDLDTRGETWVARFAIDPGPPTIVSVVNVGVSGPGEADEDFAAAVAEFPLLVGDTLNHPLYEKGKARIAAIAAEKGYLDAEFVAQEIRVDVQRSTAEISLDFRTGPRYVFGPVTIHQDIVHPRRMQGYVTMEPGDPFSAQALLDLQSNLEAATYIRRAEVRVERERADGLQVPIEIDVYPTRPARFEVGAGYGTDTGIRGTFEVLFRRLNRWGHTGTFRAEVSQIELSAAFEYEIPPIFPGTATWSVVGGIGDFSPDWSTTFLRTLGVRLRVSRWGVLSVFGMRAQGQPLGRALGLRHELRHRHVPNRRGGRGGRRRAPAAAPGGQIEPPQFLVQLDKVRDRGHSEDPSRPPASDWRRGGEQVPRLERQLLPADSEREVGPGDPAQDADPGARSGGTEQAGQNFTSDFPDLPPSARFVAGGVESVRGYAFQSLGPMLPRPDGELVLVGGKSLLTGSFETDVIFPTGKLGQLGFAVFVDTGNALRSFSDIQLEIGVGAGLRWVSPVGVVRLDGAFGVSQPGPPFRIHFSMGPDIAP